MIGLLLSVIMVVAIGISFGVVAAPTYAVDADLDTVKLTTNYLGSSLATSSEVFVRRGAVNITSYAQTRLYANGSLACTGSTIKLTAVYVKASSGWATTDTSKTYSGRLYGKGTATGWNLLMSWY